MHPHIPRPRRKATRTCTDTAGVVRTVHGEFLWPFTARVNEKTAPIERIAAVAICRRLRDACRQIYAPPSNGQRPALRALPPMTAQIATALGPVLDQPGALQQPSTVHVSEGSSAERLAASIFRPDYFQKRTSLMRSSTSDLCQQRKSYLFVHRLCRCRRTSSCAKPLSR
jgi:hypothetical protein